MKPSNLVRGKVGAALAVATVAALAGTGASVAAGQPLLLLGGEPPAVAAPAGRAGVTERMDEQVDAQVENGCRPGQLLEQHVLARGMER